MGRERLIDLLYLMGTRENKSKTYYYYYLVLNPVIVRVHKKINRSTISYFYTLEHVQQ